MILFGSPVHLLLLTNLNSLVLDISLRINPQCTVVVLLVCMAVTF